MKRRDFIRRSSAFAGFSMAGRLGFAATARRPMSDVIVVLPGICGSVLRQGGKDVWALSGQGLFGAVRSLGASLESLEFKGGFDEDIDDGVIADRLVDDVHVVPGLWRIDGYTRLRRTILDTFDVQEGKNYFEFPYDWRKNVRFSAASLATKSRDWLKRWRDTQGLKGARLILLAHSMGGLVSRYFVDCLEGWRDVRMLITFGTPFGGSVDALSYLANGLRKKAGRLTLVDLTKVVQSCPSVYQLLPTFASYDPGDGKRIVVGNAKAIPNVRIEMAAAALRFHETLATAVRKNANSADYRERGYYLRPVVGIFQPTLQAARLESGSLVCSPNLPGEFQPADGDGTVPRPSATPSDLVGKHVEAFAVEKHGSLQNNDRVLEQVMGALSDASGEWMTLRGAPIRVSLTIDDIFADDEPIQIAARYSPKDAPVTMQVSVADASTNAVVAEKTEQGARDGMQAISLPPLREGTYRVTLTGIDRDSPKATVSVTDVFVVAHAS